MKKDNIEELSTQEPLSEEEKQKLYSRLQELEEPEIPEGLQPEAMVTKLRVRKQRQWVSRMTKLAAVLALVLGIGVLGNSFLKGDDQTTAGQEDQADESILSPQIEEKKKQQVGNFHLASSYEEIYEAVRIPESNAWYEKYTLSGGKDAASPETATDDSVSYGSQESSQEAGNYSTTNLQVEGVDEGDIVKNDGEYLYLCAGQKIYIVDIRQETMVKAATISPEMKDGDQIEELFVEDDRLLVILNIASETNEWVDSDDLSYEFYATYDCAYNYGAYEKIKVLTYDISNREEPKLMGTISQDGSYKTARKVGDYLYLFTEDSIRKEDPVPEFNQQKASCDCIYYQKEADHQLMISSMNVENPDTIVDYLVVMDRYGEIYVGNSAIYVYGYEYQAENTDDGEEGDTVSSEGGGSYTRITKFSYEEGKLNGEESVRVRGDITDTFAISEKEGSLRVLTTEYKAKSENRLYVFDETLSQIGYLSELAVGEEIYSARYIGDMAYFITYHNTDPLFVVDLSDETDPRVLGHVEITGFSEYLHPYGEGLLLGIGYETGEDGGSWQGIKLVMFDVTDPAQPKVVDSALVGADYSPAVYDYKCVLADSEKNIIGFSGIDSQDGGGRYYLYTWEGDHFSLKMKETTALNYLELDRSVYAGDRLYVCRCSDAALRVISYDMKNDYQEVDRLVLK